MTQQPFVDQLTELLKGEVRQELAFPEATYQERVRKVTSTMAARGIDVIIATHLPHICHLTGYQFTNCDYAGFLVLGKDGRAGMVVPGTEVSTVVLHGWVRDVRDFPSWEPLKAIPLIADVLSDWGLGAGTIGLELSLELMDLQARDALTKHLTGWTFVDTTDLISGGRAVRETREIEHQRQAGLYSIAGLDAAVRAVRPGVRECEVAAEASGRMIALGSEFFPTAPLVAAGTRSSVPHAMFGRHAIAAGDLVVVELAGVYERYAVPVSRTVVAGTAPSRALELAEVGRRVLDTLTAGATAGERIGPTTREARSLLPDGLWPVTSLGHAIGVGMPPTWQDDLFLLHDDSFVRFEAGMSFYSVVRMHVPGELGVVIGDSWTVGPDGVQPLARHPHDLVTVDAEEIR